MSTKPNWTVLVYMVADTGDTFYQDAMSDVTEMMGAKFGDEIKVVVHADAPSPWLTKCWEVSTGLATEIPNYGDGLLDFVQKSVDQYESENYLLVLWGHGEGIDWKQKVLGGRSTDPPIVGVGKRFAPGSQGAIEVGELGRALAGLRLDKVKKKNVVVGFDACLMGMVEVYDEIQRYAGWAVAANDEIPVTGWPYKDVLQLLGDSPGMQPNELAEKIVESCADWYSTHSPDTKVSFAACDLSKSNALITAVSNLAVELGSRIDESSMHNAVKKARDYAEDLEEIAYIDLYAFCSELNRQTKTAQAVQEAAKAAIDCVNDFVIGYQFSDGYPQRYSKDSRALSICFPASKKLVGSVVDLRVNWGSYIDLTFCQETLWPEFLTSFWERRRFVRDLLFRPNRKAAAGRS
jgi:hypothetical protein